MRIARRRVVRRLDDVVLALEAMGDLAQGIRPGEAHGPEQGGVGDEAASGARIPADRGPHQSLQAMRGELLADDEGAQADEARNADAGRGDERACVDTIDAMVVGIGIAVLMRAAYREVDVACGDGRSGEQIGHERGVEAGLEVQALVQHLVPERCGATGDAGEGDLAPRGVGDSSGGVVRRGLGRGEGSRVSADDRAGGDDDPRLGAGPRAGNRRDGLERGPRRGGELVVDRRGHAGGDGLVDRGAREQPPGERAGHAPGRADDPRLSGGVGGPARDPVRALEGHGVSVVVEADDLGSLREGMRHRPEREGH